MLNKIAKQGLEYYQAIHMSAETAQKGCFFSQGAVDFCKRLFRAQDFVGTLKSSLGDIKETAKSAHHNSEETHERFKSLRNELIIVCFLTLLRDFCI
jgi:FixJ family two-component response regulator